jgi:hypothetical protein
MSSVVETEVSTKENIETKEDLAELRRRLEEANRNAAKTPVVDSQGKLPAWFAHDVDGLIWFLESLRDILTLLISNRIPPKSSIQMMDHWEMINIRIMLAIANLRTIDSANHPLYIGLYNAGLAEEALDIKLGEYQRCKDESPVLSVLEMADRILGSLFRILTELEPVKEFKETIESKIRYGADNEITALDLNGREGWWKKK